MKHLKDFNINEAKYKFMNKPLKTLKAPTYRQYSIIDDNFIRYVWCDKKEKFLTEGRKYRLYAEFETGIMISGKCFIVLANNQQFMGFDSEYFLEDWQWDATKKYNL
jgi:hypothetical protein